MPDEIHNSIEAGKTYEFQPALSGNTMNRGRRALAIRQSGEGHWIIRWANGGETIADQETLHPADSPLRPGVDEPCSICGGARQLAVTEGEPDKPWIRITVGHEPCPNCGGSKPD